MTASNTRLYQPVIETMSREDIRALQLEKLQKQVAYVYERVEWYRNKMDEMGVSPQDIQTLDDGLARYVSLWIIRGTFG